MGLALFACKHTISLHRVRNVGFIVLNANLHQIVTYVI